MLRQRRAFLSTLIASVAAIAGRVALLPQGLSPEQIERLGASTSSSAPATADSDYDLSGSMNLNDLAQQFELGPPTFRYSRVFSINTVERRPQPGLVERGRWSVPVDGLVDSPFQLTPDTLAELPPFAYTGTFHCVEGWAVPNARWTGVQLAEILRRAQPQSGARFVTFHSLGGVYTDSLTVQQALRAETLLATHLDGEPLPDRQGYPIRLVVPFMYGYKSVKWLSHITVEERRQVGFWERRGWQLDPFV
ncbi:MAG TPA: molybdopterin-dependent oxidoreductase [Chloroflexota bacterium]|nr:molybdopterin-dependent oxidoreductase [Chloroflexota bacterium]